jgi:hypothetical protein
MILTDIQKLQFSDKQKAEGEMLGFLRANEDPAIDSVELTPKPQSLNSINGFLTYKDGERLFFKTHTEENEKNSEYYNAEALSKAGYPVFQAKLMTHRPGKQIAIYEIISLPTLFDLIKTEEDSSLATGEISATAAALLRAQEKYDKVIPELYSKTLTTIDAEKDKSAPVHQLFSHRLAADGRLNLFYLPHSLNLGSEKLPFQEIAKKKWVINGVEYSETLNEIIERSRRLVQPNGGPAIVGHGDAHNGNLFVDLDSETFNMFDPAFAGLHSPLIDMTKPTAHNHFFRWMYYPEQVEKEFELKYKITPETIVIDHSFHPSKLRLEFLELRKKHVLRPTIKMLAERKALPDNWRDIFRSSLFCCPFLTVNLLAEYKSNGSLAERYGLPVRLLGLSMAVEFGALQHRNASPLTDEIDDLFST